MICVVINRRGPPGLENLVGLANRKCKACEGGDVQAMDEAAVNTLRNQVGSISAGIYPPSCLPHDILCTLVARSPFLLQGTTEGSALKSKTELVIVQPD